MRNNSPPFIPKRPVGIIPWQTFGSDRATYEKWVSHICGICCVGMVAAHYTRQLPSLWELTQWAIKLGVFRENPNGEIEGAFHNPLVSLAQELGLEGKVERQLDESILRYNLGHERFTLLSIDLQKIQQQLMGSHLILIHSVQAGEEIFQFHDCAHVVTKNGENGSISFAELERVSNHKGITLWAPPKTTEG